MAALALCVLLQLQSSLASGKASANDASLDSGHRSDLLPQIVTILGDGQSSKDFLYSSFNDIPTLTAELRPMLAALPEDDNARFGPSAVRFALHRLFLARHGWVLEGLDPEGQAWNSASPSQVAVLRNMPPAVRELVDKRFHEEGFNLDDTAVLAATIEHLVHAEASKRLYAVYAALNLPLRTAQARSTVQLAVDAYMGSYILGVESSTLNATGLRQLVEDLPRSYMQPSWSETHDFLSGYVRKESQLGHLDFDRAAAAVAKMGENYGKWQNKACLAIKDDLVALEHKDTGRVLLRDFYDAAVKLDKWEFSESAAYLRSIGALDESLPGFPRVIIPNYINSPSNCLAASNFYSVCCISECEDIRRKIESAVAAPEATADKLLDVVARIKFPQVAVPQWSSLMEQRLRRIAQIHDGNVPLNSRLFAQWLHHAFPRECPYPYVSEQQESSTQEEWKITHPGVKARATKEEMQQVISAGRPHASAPTLFGRWTEDEELVSPKRQPRSPLDIVRSVLMV